MKINFYNTKITKKLTTILVKEKTVNYSICSLDTPKKVTDMMNQLISMGDLAEEHCYMLAYNTQNIIIGLFFLSKGTVNRSLIGTREVYMRALLCGAVHIILIHNHPSKNVFPSREDLHITKKIHDAGDLIGIHLIDHIIIGGNNFYSLKENNYI